ncbi:GNAT family N-acetyltransferase [Oceanirhabdus sp. W0125-5]|uniref:GNAT family N-acetyltransferase n=1 Tax=Oceanirhabdus sp. W0125-5 TaxID=2999116 RepID=UPI0022F2FEDD|nr:GNAT family N-acetyltransferase [Oceanirhabdus sp. W0125-5]WBW96325.1 GNAT family N-acetyltransferase [Oceanirhabdus sp. W0125-5]
MYEVKRGILTGKKFINLVEGVGWGHPTLEQIEIAIENSLYNACVLDGDEIIAMGRIIGDNSMSYLIKDVVVNPKYQGKGIGKLLINDMLTFLKEKTPKGWKFCIELMSASGKEGFYEKFGFEKRPSVSGGAGMFLLVDNK